MQIIYHLKFSLRFIIRRWSGCWVMIIEEGIFYVCLADVVVVNINNHQIEVSIPVATHTFMCNIAKLLSQRRIISEEQNICSNNPLISHARWSMIHHISIIKSFHTDSPPQASWNDNFVSKTNQIQKPISKNVINSSSNKWAERKSLIHFVSHQLHMTRRWNKHRAVIQRKVC